MGTSNPLISKGQAQHLQLLLDISRQVAANDTLEEMLKTIVEIAAQETASERATLFLNDPATGELYSRFAQGAFHHEIRVQNASGIAGHVYSSGRGIIIHDAYQDERFNRTIDQETGFTTRNILCAPVKTVRGEVIGVIQALNKLEGDFNEEDLLLLESMTSQAALTLQSAQTIERMQKSRDQELEFLDLVADVTSELELSSLLQKVMAEATKMLDAERSTLFLNDEKGKELWSEVGQGLEATQIRFPNHLGIAGAVFTSGRTINIPYAYADLRFNPSFDRQTGFFTRSILCVPVVNKNDQVIGVTQVLNKRGGPFTAEDEARLKAFTAQIAIGLENAKLFNDVQNMKNYNESMLESMSNGVITIDEKGKIVTCNAAGLRIMKQRASDVIDHQGSDFFTGDNAWIMKKVKQVEAKQTPEVVMDGGLSFRNQAISVNVTILPLLSVQKERLGSMVMLEDISSEKRVKSTMARYMDPALAEQLLAGGDDILGGKSVLATVLFSDIRGFTTLTEELGAQGTVALLNEYFTIMVDCIQQQGGMLDKFIGDAIMAGFGIPVSYNDDEDRAVRAAISMLTELRTWNAKRLDNGKRPVDMGIGLNTDHVVSGNIGSPKRMDFTMIGDGVNLAARLESACKQYHARILISENTFRRLKGSYRNRRVDDVVVKGKTQPVGVFEILDYHNEESFPNIQDVLQQFRAGRETYVAGNWARARGHFQEALRANPGDLLSASYVERCERLLADPPEDWNGIWVMTSK